MEKHTLLAILVLALVGSGVVTATMPIDAQPDEQPMGVWITDINGIPLHQTEQFGKFAIFEVTPRGGT